MKVVEIEGKFGLVQTGRLKKRVSFELQEGLKVGDYVIVHAGFAIQKLDPQEARQTLKLIDEIQR
jgi:hydrogenase expression/formation protein HypC